MGCHGDIICPDERTNVAVGQAENMMSGGENMNTAWAVWIAEMRLELWNFTYLTLDGLSDVTANFRPLSVCWCVWTAVKCADELGGETAVSVLVCVNCCKRLGWAGRREAQSWSDVCLSCCSERWRVRLTGNCFSETWPTSRRRSINWTLPVNRYHWLNTSSQQVTQTQHFQSPVITNSILPVNR